MKVDVQLTEEQRATVPDFEQQVKRFQRRVDGWTKRDKFRLSLHEGAHIWARRKFGALIDEFQGPHVEWKHGEPLFVNGSIGGYGRRGNDEWESAVGASAGYLAVEILTGAPDTRGAIENDIEGHSKAALGMAEIYLRSEIVGATDEIIEAAREYAVAVYGSDECVDWGWKEFHLQNPTGERYAVGGSASGEAALLVQYKDGSLRVFINGVEYTPLDRINGCEPRLVVPYGEKREGAEEAVKLWNCVIAATYITHPQLVG